MKKSQKTQEDQKLMKKKGKWTKIALVIFILEF